MNAWLVASMAGPPFDLRPFETVVLPRWLGQFRIAGVEGAFGSSAGGGQRVYGTADVVHVLSTVNQLNLSEGVRDAWAAQLAAFQNLTVVCGGETCPGLPPGSRWPGFYELGVASDDVLSVGGEPWHSTGDVTSAFRLLHRWPKAPNPMYRAIAADPALWHPTFLPTGKGLDRHSGVLATHKIVGILGTLLMQEPGAAVAYAPFLRWWGDFIDAHVDTDNGFLCTVKSVPPCKCSDPACSGGRCMADALSKCVAPTFATAMVKRVGLNRTWPNSRRAQRTILDLQRPTGFWSDGSLPGYHEIDSLFIAVRTLPWNEDRRPEVLAACAAFLHAVTTFGETGFGGSGLNDADTVLKLFPGTHNLAAPIYAVSICAEEFPQLVRTVRPWSFSGDWAPFI